MMQYIKREIDPDGVPRYIFPSSNDNKPGKLINILAALMLMVVPTVAQANGTNGGSVQATISVTVVTQAFFMGLHEDGTPYGYDLENREYVEPQYVCNADNTECSWEIIY